MGIRSKGTLQASTIGAWRSHPALIFVVQTPCVLHSFCSGWIHTQRKWAEANGIYICTVVSWTCHFKGCLQIILMSNLVIKNECFCCFYLIDCFGFCCCCFFACPIISTSWFLVSSEMTMLFCMCSLRLRCLYLLNGIVNFVHPSAYTWESKARLSLLVICCAEHSVCKAVPCRFWNPLRGLCQKITSDLIPHTSSGT